jgi:hypothetical protein
MSGQRSDWRERLRVNPSRMEQELAIKLQENGISYSTQVEIPVTTVDFYFPIQPRLFSESSDILPMRIPVAVLVLYLRPAEQHLSTSSL